jgi:alpha-mannosidase
MTPSVPHSNTELISEVIKKLRSFCQVDVNSTWLCSEDDLAIADVAGSDLSDWKPVQLDAKEQIPWTEGQKILWLAQKIIVPQDLYGYPLAGLSLRLALVWWADSVQVYVNGKLAVEGDLFDFSPRVLLSKEVKPGDEFLVAVRLVSPGHCDGALMKSLLVFESNDACCPEPGFVADELAVVMVYLQEFAPEQLNELARVVGAINYCPTNDAQKKKGEEFDKLLFSLRHNLLQFKIPHLKSKIQLLGHAHLDLAWLWPVSETWKVAQNTFESVLKLQSDFPELVFCHSTPGLYGWVEEHRPDLFKAIQGAVAAGRWEVVGGFWVEPELNLIAGESIVRQLLYGQRYTQEKFGKLATVVWVPDTFGFCWTLPQFFALSGIEYFVTQKLRWNDTTKFEYGAFWWRSPDGSEVFSYMSALIGEGIDPVKMAAYACEWQTQTGIKDALWLPGVGDHGGGPTRDMLETARRWQKSPLFPQLEFTTAESYLQDIQRMGDSLQVPTPFPTWDDELYLEFHRGCYTSHADQKRWNRRCENLLYQAELFASFATITCGIKYPQGEIEAAWKKVLFNQFHDILPGSSITQVYQEALLEWQEVEQAGTKILEQSLQAIASQVVLPEPPHPEAKPIFVFNPLNWERSEVVEVVFPDLEDGQNCNWQICELNGREIESQWRFIGPRRRPIGETPIMLMSFLADQIPACGYRVFWLCPCEPLFQPLVPLPKEFVLENEHLRVTIDPKTGDLSSVFDKINQHEVLSGPGNQLQAFQDKGQYWDAWNIDPNYAEHPLAPAKLSLIYHLERGAVRRRIRVVRKIGQSKFSQDYILEKGSGVLKIKTIVDWQERQVLVKAAFPLNIEADFATYEIPAGSIRRPTKPETPAEKAKWEVPALRWADLTKEGEQGINPSDPLPYGVSLLNDCKYGYDAQPSQLRLTLLRSPNWPDPESDKGYHEFTYALYPHANSWEKASTVKRGYELNIPLQVLLNPPLLITHSPSTTSANKQGMTEEASYGGTETDTANRLMISDKMSFLDLSAENLILMAFKQAEDNPEQWVLRCYECHGDMAEFSLQGNLGLIIEDSVDLLERKLSVSESSPQHQRLTVGPWKIVSFTAIFK